MKPKLLTTILCMCMCAVLLTVVLAMPERVEAQEMGEGPGGYNVSRAYDVVKVAQYANNAMVNDVEFEYVENSNANIADAPTDETLTIKIGYGLIITNDDSVRGDTTGSFMLMCKNADTEDDYDPCDTSDPMNPSATFSNKDGNGIITITIGSSSISFKVAGVRVDASDLDLGDEIMVSVTSTTDATSVPLGGSSSGSSISGVVGVVSAGLKVTAEKDADLACSEATAMPSITVAEGFSMAWGPAQMMGEGEGEGIDMQTASITIMLDHLPDGAKVEWPETVKSMVDVGSGGVENLKANGMLTMNSAESSSNGKVVVYDYEMKDTYGEGAAEMMFDEAARSFKIMPSKLTFMSDASVDISAMLYPMARRGTDGEKLDLDSTLSFEAMMQMPDKGMGEGWLVISECVTYLLYPFITCGATPGWSTGISVANTTADGNIFGEFDMTEEQMGAVVMYGFPSGQAMTAEGEMVMPVVSMLSDNLMAGDTMTFDCGNTMMAGMEGYAIIKASFQHARGMAFVLGNFADGAGVDVSHGYMAEVIEDPSMRTDVLHDH